MAKIVMIPSKASSLLNFRKDLMLEFLARGHSVSAMMPDEDPTTEKALLALGITPFKVELSRTGLNPVHDLIFTKKLAAELKRIQPDLVFSYTIKPVIFGSIAARLAGVKSIYSMVTGLGYAFTAKGLKAQLVGLIAGALYRIAFMFNQGIIFQNEDDPALLRRRHILSKRSRVTVVNGSGVDLSHFAHTPIPSLDQGLRFLMTARLVYEKGIREYMAAARILKEKYPTAVFQLLGGAESRLGAVSKSDLSAASDIVEYLGETKDVRPFIQNAHVFVLPSYGEGTPRTVLEAMATGRPIITTDAPGCRQTIESGVQGFIVAPQSVPELVQALESFIKDPSLVAKMGARSYDRACERYDVRKVNAQMFAAIHL